MVSLAIPTYKRPALLRRLLVSFAGSGRHASLEEAYVFDDDETANNEAEAVVSQINRDHNLAIAYVGCNEKLSLVREIAGSNKDFFAILQFALWGIKECRDLRMDGINRNAILLRCIDKKVVCADDDIAAEYVTYKKPTGFVEKTITGRKYQRIQENPFFAFSENGWDYYRNRLVLLTDDPFLEFDRILGSSPQTLGFNYPLDGIIRIAYSGVFGGRWYISPLAILNVNPLNYRMWKNQDDYTEARQLPCALYLSPLINITTDSFFFAAHFGYDTSALLPPFLPHIRNGDGIWATMVRKMYPASPFCRLPFAVYHDRKQDSPLPSLSALHAGSTANGLMNLFISYIGDTLRSRSPEEHLQSLGGGLVSAAALRKASWRDLTKGLYDEMQSGMMGQAEQKLESLCGKQPFLAADLSYYIDVLKRENGTVKPWIPAEFARFGAKAESLFRNYVKRCGELFLAWPELWERAKSL